MAKDYFSEKNKYHQLMVARSERLVRARVKYMAPMIMETVRLEDRMQAMTRLGEVDKACLLVRFLGERAESCSPTMR